MGNGQESVHSEPIILLQTLPYTSKVYLGDNCIQHFHLGWYIVGYTVGNFVLPQRVSRAVKHNFRTYIRQYTNPNEYGYPHSNVLFNFYASKTRYLLQNVSCLSDIKPLRRPITNDVAHTVGFPTSQNILSQFFDVVQSDVTLYSQVH